MGQYIYFLVNQAHTNVHIGFTPDLIQAMGMYYALPNMKEDKPLIKLVRFDYVETGASDRFDEIFKMPLIEKLNYIKLTNENLTDLVEV